MSRVVMVIAPEVFRDEEYSEPLAILTAAGHEVVTASTRIGECIGKLGMRATATITVSQAANSIWDAVVFIGGGGAAIFFDDGEAHRLARDAKMRGVILAAICIAPSTLAHAGLLDGIRATAFPTQQTDLVTHGATWTGTPVEIDGRVITASGPEAARDFGEAIVRALS